MKEPKIVKILFCTIAILWTTAILLQQYLWWTTGEFGPLCFIWAVMALGLPVLVYLAFKD